MYKDHNKGPAHNDSDKGLVLRDKVLVHSDNRRVFRRDRTVRGRIYRRNRVHTGSHASTTRTTLRLLAGLRRNTTQRTQGTPAPKRYTAHLIISKYRHRTLTMTMSMQKQVPRDSTNRYNYIVLFCIMLII